MISVYLARAMTGRSMKEVYYEAKKERIYLEKHGFKVLDPVSEEGVRPKNKNIQATYRQLVTFWARDKEMIRQAHMVFDMTPWMKSEGVTHEIGYARYFLWKPVVRVYGKEKRPSAGSVAYFEDDVLAKDLDHAIYKAEQLYRTWYKRFKWRLLLLNRCLLKFFWYQLLEWK